MSFIKNEKDFWSGVLFIVMGVAFAIGAQNYTMGQGARMGPGYFPYLLGVMLAALGLWILVLALRGKKQDSDNVGKFAWRPLVYVIAGNLLFGLCLGGLKIGSTTLIPQLGLIVGIFAVVIVASYASPLFSMRNALISAVGLSVGSYLVFIKMLKLVIPVWPAFLTA